MDREFIDTASAVRAANSKDWKGILREFKYQKIKRKALKASRENRSIEVNVKGIERLLQGQ